MKKLLILTSLISTIVISLLQPYALAAQPNSAAHSGTSDSVLQTGKQSLVSTVNINKANAESIATSLNGIGLKKAQAIVAFRNVNGPFKTAEELALVKGIGIKTVNKNTNRIKLK